MSALWWQYAVVALLVAASLLTMLRKLAPQASWRWQARLAAWLLRRRAAPWRALGRRLLPPSTSGGACGGGGCDGCSAAAAADAQAPLERKITFHPRR
jgi:hypothetical protein